MNVIFMGAGEKLSFLLKALPIVGKSYRLAEIWDNSLERQRTKINFQGVDFKISAPHSVSRDMLVLITADRYEAVIRRQLIQEIGLKEEQIRTWRFLFDGVRREIISRYEGSMDRDLSAAVDYLRHHELDVFVDGLREKYHGQETTIQVLHDESAGLYYVMWHGRKLYMKRSATSGWVQDYMNDIYREQDRKSPHCYGQFMSEGLKDAVLVDAGAAEGFFALDFVEEANKIYLVEHDPEWVEALSHTFAPYRKKVTLVDKWLGDQLNDECTTLDRLDTLGAPISFIKMDIEGAEESAFNGGEKVFSDNRTLRILACTYHRSQDAKVLAEHLLARRFTARFSPGYMFFPYGEDVAPELRHGLLYGEKRERKRVAMWGVGESFNDVFAAIRQDTCELAAIVDMGWETFSTVRGIKVSSPEILRDSKVDYVVLTPKEAESMREQGRELGLQEGQMLSFWKQDLSRYPFIYADAWEKSRVSETKRRIAMRLRNAPYEYGASGFPLLRSGEAALKEVIQYKKSLCRLGDGEFDMIRRRERPWFQKTSDTLAIRMREVIGANRSNLCVALADNFGSLQKYTEEAADAIRSYVTAGNTRQEVRDLLNDEVTYYDAYVSRPYLIYQDKSNAPALFSLWKQVWEKRDVLLVEGSASRMGRGNDLLANANTVRRILCPGKNAFEAYARIWEQVRKSVREGDLVLISLGPTATVLAYDLAAEGIQAIDVGQLDNEYDWYRMGAQTRQIIKGKTVAELSEGHHPAGIEDKEYEQEVIAHVTL